MSAIQSEHTEIDTGHDEPIVNNEVAIQHSNSEILSTENIPTTEATKDSNNSSNVVCCQSTSVTTTTLTVSITPPKMKPPIPTQAPQLPNALSQANLSSQNVNGAPKLRRSSETGTRTSCPICQNESVKRKNAVDVLKCSVCNNFVHFACSNLPPYMLYALSSSAKKYTCETCSATPEPFLTNIVNNICNGSNTPERPITDNRMDLMEHKVNSIMVILEKFDLQALTENLSALGSKMEQTNNNLTGNVRAIQQLKKDHASNVTEANSSNSSNVDRVAEEVNQLGVDLERTKKDLAASQHSNELLISTVTERDTTLATLRDKFEKNINKLNERERRVTLLENEKKQLQEANTTVFTEKSTQSEQWLLKLQNLNKEKDDCSNKLDEVQNKLIHVSGKLDAAVEVNNALKDQIKTLVEINLNLQTSISRPPARRNANPQPSRQSTSDQEEPGEEEDDEGTRDEVVILHDSLCGKINDSLLSRENVRVKKVWAPDIERMEEALDNVDAKVVVLEAWTRDLNNMEIDEMNQKIAGLVSKAVTKAEKVVLSTIIRREDEEDIDLKADFVNAYMKLTYKRNEDVVVCDNYKLYDGRFRKDDKIHLNDDGVPIFASNLKYAIAEAVGVQVQQRRNNRFEQRFDNRRNYRR